MSAFPYDISAQTLGPIRFGYGHAPRVSQLQTGQEIFDSLALPPVQGFAPQSTQKAVQTMSRALRMTSKGNKTKDEDLRQRGRDLRRAQFHRGILDAGKAIARVVAAPSPFHERLVWHFTNHFSVAPRNTRWSGAMLGFVEDAIRPHVMGHFRDMLRAVETHPAMLIFLDQQVSMGPNSKQGKAKQKGLNENLAREMLELHSVGSGYTQNDVRQLAELLTGMVIDGDTNFAFRQRWAEPGAETVLGKVYGGQESTDFAPIEQFLNDLAAHPDTARHVCTRLARHFVADVPDPDLIAHMTAAWAASDGYLPRVYEAMLEHPASWRDFGAKVKTPIEFVCSSLLAIGVTPAEISTASQNQVRKFVLTPLVQMGQGFLNPATPEGWPETEQAWITPQLLTERIGWAMTAPYLKRAGGFRRPDAWAKDVLKEAARPDLIVALTRASNKLEGAGLMLASPDFQRR